MRSIAWPTCPQRAAAGAVSALCSRGCLAGFCRCATGGPLRSFRPDGLCSAVACGGRVHGRGCALHGQGVRRPWSGLRNGPVPLLLDVRKERFALAAMSTWIVGWEVTGGGADFGQFTEIRASAVGVRVGEVQVLN